MSVPRQSFHLINVLSCIIEYDHGKSIYINDFFLLYYWGGGGHNDCYYITKDKRQINHYAEILI